MSKERSKLERQVELVFAQLSMELKYATSGTIVLQVRDDSIGKFGIRHEPIALDTDRKFKRARGLNAQQQEMFLRLALESLSLKHWTYGEIQLDFAIRQDRISISVTFESNYNMSNVSAIRLVG
jgi:hypothetical protein